MVKLVVQIYVLRFYYCRKVKVSRKGKGQMIISLYSHFFAQMKCLGAEPEGLFNIWIALLYDKSWLQNCKQTIKL